MSGCIGSSWSMALALKKCAVEQKGWGHGHRRANHGGGSLDV